MAEPESKSPESSSESQRVPYYQRGGDFFFHVAESIVTALGLIMIMAVPLATPLGMNLMRGTMATPAMTPIAAGMPVPVTLISNIADSGLAIVLLFGILFLVRTIKSRGLFLALMCLFVFGLCGFVFYKESWHAYRAIHDMWPRNITGKPPIMLPMMAMNLPMFVLPIAGFLAGIYAVRRSFSYLKFAAGSIIGLIAAYLLIQTPSGIAFGGRSTVAIALHVLFFLLLLKLPLQRRGFERLFSLDLKHDQTPMVRNPAPFAVALMGHLGLILLILLIVFASFHTYHSNKIIRQFIYGPQPFYRSPTEVNAWSLMESDFSHQPPDGIDLRKSHISFSGDGLYYYLYDGGSKEQLDYVVKNVTPDEIEKARTFFGSHMEAFVEASEADYFFSYPKDINFISIRETARALAAEAAYLYATGRREEAFENIGAIYRLGGMMKVSESGLIAMMIGVALQNIANGQVESFYYYSKEDTEELEALLEFMESHEDEVYRSLNVEAFRRGEPAFGEVVTMFELSMPGFTRAFETYYRTWNTFDALQIFIAAELFKHEHDGYPEYMLDMVPELFDDVPADPENGLPYIYGLTATGLRVVSKPGDDRNDIISPEPPDNDDIRMFMESAKSE